MSVCVRTCMRACVFVCFTPLISNPPGSHGEALVFEPLRLQWDMADHPIAKYHLVAVGTVDKVRLELISNVYRFC